MIGENLRGPSVGEEVTEEVRLGGVLGPAPKMWEKVIFGGVDMMVECDFVETPTKGCLEVWLRIDKGGDVVLEIK